MTRRKDPSLQDLSPTKAIKLLLRVKKQTTTQAADENFSGYSLFASPVPDNLTWAACWHGQKKASWHEKNNTNRRLCLQPNNLKRKLAGWVVNLLRTSRQRSLNRTGEHHYVRLTDLGKLFEFRNDLFEGFQTQQKRKQSRRFSRRSRRT